jgi:hypothetical protein
MHEEAVPVLGQYMKNGTASLAGSAGGGCHTAGGLRSASSSLFAQARSCLQPSSDAMLTVRHSANPLPSQWEFSALSQESWQG